MIDQALKESEINIYSWGAKMAWKTIIDALEMCAVKEKNRSVRSVPLLAITSIIGDVFEEDIVAEQQRKAAMKAVIHPVMIEAVTDALLKEDQLMCLIATFVSTYVEKESARVKT